MNQTPETIKWTEVAGVIVSIPVGIATITQTFIMYKEYRFKKKENNPELNSSTIAEAWHFLNLLGQIISLLEKAELYFPLIQPLKGMYVEKRNYLSERIKALQKRIDDSQTAATWLDDNKIKQLAQELCKIVLEDTLNKNPNLIKTTDEDWQGKVAEFNADIYYYLKLIRRCLETGRVNVLEEASYYQSLPADLYLEAFEYINRLTIPQDLPIYGHDLSIDAFKELKNYLVHLIRKIRTKLS